MRSSAELESIRVCGALQKNVIGTLKHLQLSTRSINIIEAVVEVAVKVVVVVVVVVETQVGRQRKKVWRVLDAQLPCEYLHNLRTQASIAMKFGI